MDKKVKGRISAILLSLAMVFTMMPMMAAPSYADSTQIEVGGIKYDLNTENYAASVTGYVGQPTEVTIPATVESGGATYTVTSINVHAFQKCGSLTNITIPNSVMSIDTGAFEESGIKSVTFENGSRLTTIEEYAFQNCKSLISITIPNGVTSIPEHAFYGCDNLQSVSIPNSVMSIDTGAFEKSGLTSVAFESGSRLTSIGEYAFQNCKSLVTIKIPNNLTSIGLHAFYNCESLRSFTIPNSVKTLGNGSFEGSGLTSVTFENGSRLTTIGMCAFKSCKSLSSITIPNSLETLGEGSFEESGLTSVTFASGSRLTSIESNVFQNCVSLTNITIPNSVTSIKFHAFFGCDSLRNITIPNSVESLEGGSFEQSGLTGVILPNSVTSIGYNAFGSCNSLSTIFYVGTEEQWNNMPDRDVNWTGGNAIKVLFVKGVEYIIEAPKGKTLTYNGKEQTGVATGTGYTLTGASATNAGTYEATATLAEDYVWADGTTDPKTIDWKIDKGVFKVNVPKGKTLTYNGKAQTGVAVGDNFTLSGTINATNAGSHTAKATLKESTDPNLVNEWADGTTEAKSIKWTINKAANPLTMKPKTATVKFSKLKKKAQPLAVTRVIKFTKQLKDKKTYTLSSAKKGKKSFKKYFKINKKTGKVTVKKGLKKGTYKVKVKVKALGNTNYKPSAAKTVTFKVKVK